MGKNQMKEPKTMQPNESRAPYPVSRIPYPAQSEDYSRIEKAILFLEENYHRQPELHEVAQSVHLSEFHFQRMFRRWAGISPKRFIQFLTLEHAKKLLEGSHSVLDATYDAG